MADVTIEALAQAGVRVARGESTPEAEGRRYTLAELAAGLGLTRGHLQAIVDGWTQEQLLARPRAAESGAAAEGEDRWSATEAITHLIVTENWYLLHMGRLVGRRERFETMPRGLGDQARQDVPKAELSAGLAAATRAMLDAIAALPPDADLEAVRDSTFFGDLSLRGWVMLAIIHDLDHLRQIGRVAAERGFPLDAVIA